MIRQKDKDNSEQKTSEWLERHWTAGWVHALETVVAFRRLGASPLGPPGVLSQPHLEKNAQGVTSLQSPASPQDSQHSLLQLTSTFLHSPPLSSSLAALPLYWPPFPRRSNKMLFFSWKPHSLRLQNSFPDPRLGSFLSHSKVQCDHQITLGKLDPPSPQEPISLLRVALSLQCSSFSGSLG